MLLDQENLFSDKQEAIGTGATVVSTNVVDMGQKEPVLGVGDNLYATTMITTAYVGGTSIQATLEGSNTEGSGYVALAVGPAVPIAEALAGVCIFDGLVPRHALKQYRYYRMSYTTVGAVTAGNVTSGLNLSGGPANVIYPKNFTHSNVLPA